MSLSLKFTHAEFRERENWEGGLTSSVRNVSDDISESSQSLDREPELYGPRRELTEQESSARVEMDSWINSPPWESNNISFTRPAPPRNTNAEIGAQQVIKLALTLARRLAALMLSARTCARQGRRKS